MAGSALGTTASAATLAEALEAAWQRAVAMREAEGQQRRAQAERSAATAPWAAPPAVELSHRDDRWQGARGSRETEAALAWSLWLPGQRSARTGAADAELALAEAARDAARLRLAGEVRETAWALVAQQAELAQAEALRQSLRALADDVERRVSRGDLPRTDALGARAELLSASAREADARQRLQAAQSRWRLLTGLADPVAPAETRPGNEPAEHPELRAASLDAERARKRLAVLQASRRDAPELKLRLISETPDRAAGAQTSVGIALRVPFATEDRNRPLEAAALASVDVAESAAQRVRDRLAADLADVRAALQSAEAQEAAEHERAALLRERAALIERSFRAGETPLAELLRTVSSAGQAEAQLARQRAATGLARARLQQALGLLP